MVRVHVICEGRTEEMFINKVLARGLIPKGVFLFPSLIGKPGHKGGNIKYERVETDVRARLLGDTAAFCTTFFDFYGLPRNFPGKDEAKNYGSIVEKSVCITDALKERLASAIGSEPLRRFIPYVQMYEFEGLLFSDPEALAAGINQKDLYEEIEKIRRGFDSPEEINDSPVTAPSKRIGKLFPGYDKPVHGALAALKMGISQIRGECRLFDGWLKSLEALSGSRGIQDG